MPPAKYTTSQSTKTEGPAVLSPQVDFLFEAGISTMKLLKGAYSCLCLVNGVGMVAFRDPYGIRWALSS